MAGTSIRRREKKFSKKMQRTLDPAMLLSRGLSARFPGANVMQSIVPLGKDEIEKDLRHMNAYYQANIAYAQQHYIYMNREELGATGQLPQQGGNNQTGAGGGWNQNSGGMPIAMPVRIDPEEEKRLQNLRKKIAICETQREFLESQYVSLRAHYVATTKELTAASKHSEGLLTFLQTLTKRRAKVLALQRARLQISREVLACLETRMETLEAATEQSSGAGGNPSNNDKGDEGDAAMTTNSGSNNNSPTKMDIDSPIKKTSSHDSVDEADIVQVWNELEEMLKEAELSCRKVPCSLTLTEKKSKKKGKKKDATTTEGDDDASNLGPIPLEGIPMPITPQGVPLMVSQLALVPDKGAAFSANGVFGSNKASMTWMEDSMPKTYDAVAGQARVQQMKDEVQLLEEELAKERQANKDIQGGIIGRRKRSDELVAMMTLLRSETEAILQRHNILLDSPEAKEAARKLHEEVVRKRAAEAAAQESEGKKSTGTPADDEGDDGAATTPAKKTSPDGKAKARKEDEENDGDDEDDGEEYEEEGEIKGEWGPGAKRDLKEGFGDDSSSSPDNRKRRKVQ